MAVADDAKHEAEMRELGTPADRVRARVTRFQDLTYRTQNIVQADYDRAPSDPEVVASVGRAYFADRESDRLLTRDRRYKLLARRVVARGSSRHIKGGDTVPGTPQSWTDTYVAESGALFTADFCVDSRGTFRKKTVLVASPYRPVNPVSPSVFDDLARAAFGGKYLAPTAEFVPMDTLRG